MPKGKKGPKVYKLSKVQLKNIFAQQRGKAQQPKPKKKQPKKSMITPAGAMLRKVGRVAGTFLGNGSLGENLGAGISKIFGQGAYTVQRNSLMAGPPAFGALENGVRIRHREYLGDVNSSVAFANTTYRLQPSVAATFPWLSQIAPSFEQYKFEGCVMYLNTTSGSAVSSTNNSLGVWGVTTVYDPTRPPLANKQQCEDYVGCTSGVPCSSILHAIECKPKSDVLERYYVDIEGATGDSLKFYDHGLVNVFTQGSQAAVDIGELWISYDIVLYNPRVAPIGTENVADHYSLSGSTISATNPFGTTASILTPVAGSGLGTTITTGGSGTGVLTLPAGTVASAYCLVYLFQSPNTVSGPKVPWGSASGNIVADNFLQGETNFVFYSPNASVITGYTASVFTITKTNNAAATITIGGSNVLPAAAAGTTVDLFVFPLPSGITLAKAREIASVQSTFQELFKTAMDSFLQQKALGMSNLIEPVEVINISPNEFDEIVSS
jgi:hypothetical protein